MRSKADTTRYMNHFLDVVDVHPVNSIFDRLTQIWHTDDNPTAPSNVHTGFAVSTPFWF